MPKVSKDAKIALLDVALEIEKTETDARDRDNITRSDAGIFAARGAHT